MTLIGDQRFIESSEKIHKMGQAEANCAPACAEDVESVDKTKSKYLFLALLCDPPCIEENAAKSLSVFNAAIFDHVDNFREFH